MIRVLFVCHGNICRSPMAEFIMKDLVLKAGLSSQFEIASAATSTEEIGNPVYRRHSASWQSMGSAVPAKQPGSCGGRITAAGICSSGWIGQICAGCSRSAAATPTAKSTCSWIIPAVRRGCRPLVLGGFRYSLDGYSRGLRGSAPRTDS